MFGRGPCGNPHHVRLPIVHGSVSGPSVNDALSGSSSGSAFCSSGATPNGPVAPKTSSMKNCASCWYGCASLNHSSA